jgi:hypothetical protein
MTETTPGMWRMSVGFLRRPELEKRPMAAT